MENNQIPHCRTETTPDTHVHDRPLSCLGTYTSVKTVASLNKLYVPEPPFLVKRCGYTICKETVFVFYVIKFYVFL